MCFVKMLKCATILMRRKRDCGLSWLSVHIVNLCSWNCSKKLCHSERRWESQSRGSQLVPLRRRLLHLGHNKLRHWDRVCLWKVHTFRAGGSHRRRSLK
jgi:hypothetical protein